MEGFLQGLGRLPTDPCPRRPSMDDKILAMYCLCTDFLKALHHAADRQQNMTDAEVMTTALVAMVFCGGNFEHARALLGTRQYIPTILSRGRFNRRLHLMQDLFVTLLNYLGETWKELNVDRSMSLITFRWRCVIIIGFLVRNSISRRFIGVISPARSGMFMGSRFISWSPHRGSPWNVC